MHCISRSHTLGVCDGGSRERVCESLSMAKPSTHKLLFFNWFELGDNLTSTPCSCRAVFKALVL